MTTKDFKNFTKHYRSFQLSEHEAETGALTRVWKSSVHTQLKTAVVFERLPANSSHKTGNIFARFDYLHHN
jgi:predicted outer membrane protein